MKHFYLFLIILLSTSLYGQSLNNLEQRRWITVETQGEVQGRHENGFVAYNDKFYLLGGRGIMPVNVFDPKTSTWESLGEVPFEMHHFQPVVYNDIIYIVGAQTGRYPKEEPLENIWLYHITTDTWEKGPEIPENRRRGSGGAVIYQDKIYWACGIDYGHTSGTNNNFDVYDLKTGEWNVLTKAPHIRDHFSAIAVDDKMYCMGGRNSSFHYENDFRVFFKATIPDIDVYDFTTDKWYTLEQNLPYPSAAGGVINMGDYILYFGGEGQYKHAYQETQCLHIPTGEISTLASLYCGRHGSGAILHDDEVWFAAGSNIRGGANMTTIEKFTANHQWEPLFDGKSLDGWQVKTTDNDKEKDLWRVEEGMIVCNSLDQNVQDYVWLINDRELSDFTLRLKFQVARESKGNSGVQVRSRFDDNAKVEKEIKGWLDGPQVDIDPRNPWRIGWIYDETRNEKRWIFPSRPSSAISKEDVDKRKVFFYYEDEGPGWNDLIIECKGIRITTTLNNIEMADYDGAGLLDDASHQQHQVGMTGKVALQLHKKAKNLIRFKDIEVCEK